MNATAPDLVGPLNRVTDFIAQRTFDRPTLVIDTDVIEAQYHALAHGLEEAPIYYAVKANPAPEIVDRLVALGSCFDAASRAEIELCLERGARPEHVSFGNTIKRASDIAFAHEAGITLFAADAEEELRKIAKHAPGAEVYIRLLTDNPDADWSLSRKFGCAPERVLPLLQLARDLALRPVGLSFHVGSQTRTPDMWVSTLDRVKDVWADAQAAGFGLSLLNIGGGFPVNYTGSVASASDYAARVMQLVRSRFPDVPRIMAEPGRALVADAGVIAAEVLLVARKSDTDLHRWVYLDIGVFSGLAETMGEAIRYPLSTPSVSGPTGPSILAGPSCDSVDVMCEKRPVDLPLSLSAGDRVLIGSTGAYTSTYATVGFNGFPPLDVVVL